MTVSALSDKELKARRASTARSSLTRGEDSDLSIIGLGSFIGHVVCDSCCFYNFQGRLLNCQQGSPQETSHEHVRRGIGFTSRRAGGKLVAPLHEYRSEERRVG